MDTPEALAQAAWMELISELDEHGVPLTAVERMERFNNQGRVWRTSLPTAAEVLEIAT